MKLSTMYLGPLLGGAVVLSTNAKPNIVFIFTDDQDLRHGSLDTQRAVQEHIVSQGTVFTNHFASVAVCCPSRVSLMRGQHAHNTNNTAIKAPGGGFPKFRAAGLEEDYLPHWLGKAGYNAEYVGKLFNGDSLLSYDPPPKGWRHIDVLLDPYTNAHNTVVMSENGARPVWYKGFHQTDVVRIKALNRLESLLKEDNPFFLMIAPTAPHVENLRDPPTPPARHLGSFANATVPRAPNFNPASDEHQSGKPSWLRHLKALNETQVAEIDRFYQRRLESLKGVDDIIDDVVGMLGDHDALDNTYIIYSTDQGYHLGTHRAGVGKSLPYLEDTNIPLAVRGPGIPKGAVSSNPSLVVDFAPTFLEIAGLRPDSDGYPPFFDGSSLLDSWKSPNSSEISKRKEAVNIEYWGNGFVEMQEWSEGDYGSYFPGLYLENDYKTMRVVGVNSSWMYSRRCSNDAELYNTKDDPYELLNLANSTDPHHQRVLSRLNALLLVSKSCTQSTCRDPWSVLQPPGTSPRTAVRTLEDALDPAYNSFYNAFPPVTIGECVGYQLASNEGPFYPSGAEFGRGLAYREPTDNFVFPEPEPVVGLPRNGSRGGGWEQREASYEMLLEASRVLTDDEIRNGGNGTISGFRT
ncbi:arylsulfatase precursor [Colletotrichum karsti]|uniref:Arylsulfatase n=1 Tax=Colletotrichum karsti TaxID=1095194 RepID=A0A9P6LMZ2_9PEZI|nr:arylsulfatase precursor [Colletotrichum karsti]KAF9878012.1 arylsulfatase precursor [Colletotrichum karsti]